MNKTLKPIHLSGASFKCKRERLNLLTDFERKTSSYKIKLVGVVYMV